VPALNPVGGLEAGDCDILSMGLKPSLSSPLVRLLSGFALCLSIPSHPGRIPEKTRTYLSLFLFSSQGSIL